MDENGVAAETLLIFDPYSDYNCILSAKRYFSHATYWFQSLFSFKNNLNANKKYLFYVKFFFK